MGRVKAEVQLAVSVTEAEALWYDVDRWPMFVSGFGALEEADEEWPAPGSTIVWDSGPGGRGRVIERSTEHDPLHGQTATVEDDRTTATQYVAFEPEGAGGVLMTVTLDYKLKSPGGPFGAVFDLLFVRRPMRDMLHATVEGFGRELGERVEL